MSRKGPSAGVLIYRRSARGIEVLLVHPGGPFWRNKDVGAWQIPKGGIAENEAPQAAALREVAEELGVSLTAPLLPLGEIRQSGGKTVIAYAAEQDLEASGIVSNTFAMEWPPHSGIVGNFPEVDAAKWLSLDEARRAMLPSQLPLIDRLGELLA